MKRRIIYAIRRARLLPLLCALTAFATSGCIREDMTDCPPVEQYLILRVVGENGMPLPGFDDVDEVTLYVFDDNGVFLKTLVIGHDGLDDTITIPLDGYTGGKIYVSAWGNLRDGSVAVTDPAAGTDMETPFLNLTDGEPGFLGTPGDQFFGMMEIDLTTHSMLDDPADYTEYVDLARKNAALSITVRELPQDVGAEAYYFVLYGQNSGYDFMGNPTQDDGGIRVTGHFEADGDFVADQPLCLIPSSEGIGGPLGMTLRLFMKSPTPGGEDMDMTGEITKDVNGDPIILTAGRTTNVLIDPDNSDTPYPYTLGDLRVRIIVTPWGQISQWEEW